MKLLAFSLATNIWVHAFPEALIAEAAKRHGMSVVHVGCGGLIDRQCVAMDEVGLTSSASERERHEVCASCGTRAERIQRTFDFDARTLADYITPEDRRHADRVLSSVTPDAWVEFEDDDVPLGRLAAYEFLLTHKISSRVIPEDLWPAYLDQLRNALLVHMASPRLLDDVRPDVAMAYNTLYSMNRVFKAHCEQRGISCYSLQGGAHPLLRLETQTMYRDDAASLGGPRSAAWQRTKSRPIGAREADVVLQAVRELFEARSAFVYSAKHGATSPEVTRDSLGIDSSRSTALVALSSRDEMFAADIVGRFSQPIDGTFVFPTQIDWLEHVIGIARRRDDLQFVVRVHPREFPNKREQVMSPNVERLKAVLDTLPDNVVVDWPTAGRGIYDVLQVCDVVLSGWSSVGAESALFGFPVVVYDTGELLGYPAELATVVRDVASYEQAIDDAMKTGVTLDRVVAAFRWYAFLYTRLAVDLRDSVPPRSTWSARRVLHGLRSRTWVPVPLWPILALEAREMRRRAQALDAGAVIADTLLNNLPSVAESSAWPESPHVAPDDERAIVADCVRVMVEMLGPVGGDAGSLSARLSNAATLE